MVLAHNCVCFLWRPAISSAHACAAAGGTISSGDSGLGAGGKGAIALAVIIALAALATGMYLVHRRRQQKSSPTEQVCMRPTALD